MPYIVEEIREAMNYDKLLDQISGIIRSPAELGYAISFLACEYLKISLHQLSCNVSCDDPVPQSLRDAVERTSDRFIYRKDSMLAPYLEKLKFRLGGEVGEYNYLMTFFIHQWLKHDSIRYKYLNLGVGVLERVKAEITEKLIEVRGHSNLLAMFDNVLGILTCVQMELYRTVVSPYEDNKMLENGSVSDLDGISMEGDNV